MSNKASLVTLFAQGQVPQGTNFADLINSQVNLAETAVQSMTGSLQTTELDTPLVSAAAVNVTATLTVAGVFSPASLSTGNITSTGTVTASAMNVTNAVSAASLNVTGDILGASGRLTVSAATVTNGILQGVGIVSAVGTTQATGATLTFTINRLQGVADGQTTGFAIPANKVGLTQYILNETATSANLWPPTGGKINGTTNNAFVLAGNTGYTIFHVTASAYGVK